MYGQAGVQLRDVDAPVGGATPPGPALHPLQAPAQRDVAAAPPRPLLLLRVVRLPKHERHRGARNDEPARP